ncbi:MAG: hypothetical protein J6Y29_05695 [Clostridiales bacterium]|nr:hypothetical protein [Clostridiales bacterium]
MKEKCLEFARDFTITVLKIEKYCFKGRVYLFWGEMAIILGESVFAGLGLGPVMGSVLLMPLCMKLAEKISESWDEVYDKMVEFVDAKLTKKIQKAKEERNREAIERVAKIVRQRSKGDYSKSDKEAIERVAEILKDISKSDFSRSNYSKGNYVEKQAHEFAYYKDIMNRGTSRDSGRNNRFDIPREDMGRENDSLGFQIQ